MCKYNHSYDSLSNTTYSNPSTPNVDSDNSSQNQINLQEPKFEYDYEQLQNDLNMLDQDEFQTCKKTSQKRNTLDGRVKKQKKKPENSRILN